MIIEYVHKSLDFMLLFCLIGIILGLFVYTSESGNLFIIERLFHSWSNKPFSRININNEASSNYNCSS